MIINRLINIWMRWEICSRHLVSNSKILIHYESESRSVMSDSLQPHTVHGVLQTRILEWVAFSLLQWIFPTQESNWVLLHCRQILYKLSYQGLKLKCHPKILYSAKISFINKSKTKTFSDIQMWEELITSGLLYTKC